MNRIIFLLLGFAFLIIGCQKMSVEALQKMVDRGEFSKAEKLIKKRLSKDGELTSQQKQTLLFELERMNRIRKDFTATREQVVEFIRKYYPEVSDSDLDRWEKEKKLEFMIIDGQKKYFKYAARNLFRLD
ncbi:MAG TPA: transglutaminase, partial [Caldithrix abyssi]|nr:transglutaminase [Caldithrix abyssi]